MMRYFYGIHLQSSKLSTAFDVIRYISEPDSIRFSHITLRGPYAQPLTSYNLRELNQHRSRSWRVRLDGAGAFINKNQNTIMIKVDLLDLSDLFFKPDFSAGTPHLTLYDGTETSYARSLLRLLYRFDFHEMVEVSHLQRISSKKPISGSFVLLYNEFYNAFREFLDHEPSAEFVKNLSLDQKLKTIEHILKQNFTEIYDNLNPHRSSSQQLDLPLDYDDD